METPTLSVKVIEARHIAAMDKGGTSDPYCRLKCNFNKQRFKTKVIDKTLTPKWEESFKFFAPYPAEGTVTLKMWDKDRWTTDDFLGEVQFDITKYADGKMQDLWVALTGEPKKKDTAPKGEVHVQITYEDGRPKKEASENGATPNSAPTTPTPEQRAADAKPAKIEDLYEIGKELGRGGFSIVKRGKNKKNGDEVAIKCINKKNLKKDELQLLTREINIMQKLHHKSIIQLIDIFETPSELFLVLELVSGGELFDQIVERGSYSEHDAANLIRQVLDGIDYMHKHGVVHRDLKPENLLCASANIIKIADFGLSKDTESGNLQTSCGTPSYVAPEVLLGGQYDNEVDIWSIGVITYVLLCGFTPFYGDNQRQLFERILHAKFDYPSPEWDDVSATAKDFVSKLLVVNPAERLTSEQALNHPWLLAQAPKRTLKSFASVQSGLRSIQEAKVVSLTVTQEGIKLINYGTHILTDHTLPSCVLLPRSMFSSFDLTLAPDANDVQVLINFTTLMDFLDCTLCDLSEDTVLPLNFVLDKWLYVSLQRAPTICELGTVINTSLAAPSSERFCFVPGELFSAITDTPQTVPSSDDDATRSLSASSSDLITSRDDVNTTKTNELRDNIILMLHPLSFSKCEESLVPGRPNSPSTASTLMTSLQPITAKSLLSRKVPSSPYDEREKKPKKRLKTTAAQVAYMEEWFKKDPLPTRTTREKMVQHLGGMVSLRQVEVWFQNRRAKHKKLQISSPSGNNDSSSQPTTPTSSSVPTTPPDITSPHTPTSSSVPTSPFGKNAPSEPINNAGTSSL